MTVYRPSICLFSRAFFLLAMALAEALLKYAGFLSIDATERDGPTGSRHADAVSLCVSNYTGIVDDTCDTLMGLLISLARGFDINARDKGATAIEVMIDWGTHDTVHPAIADNKFQCTSEDMDMLSKVVTIMMVNKDKSTKDAKATLDFMQRCERARQAVIEPTNPATEQIHLDRECVTACHKRFALDFLQSSLLPHQEQNRKYHIKWYWDWLTGCWDWSYTTPQRSFIKSILRTNLGDSKVAFRIWEVGLPRIARESVQGITDVCMLQSCMYDCLHWFASLAKDLVQHTGHPDYPVQLALSSLTPSADQNRRKEKLQQARQKLLTGKRLAAMRESKKRTYDEMCPSDQQVLEDFETGKCQKHVRANQVERLQPFRSNTFVGGSCLLLE